MKDMKCVCVACRFLPLAEKNLAEPLSLLMNKRRLREPIGAHDTPLLHRALKLST